MKKILLSMSMTGLFLCCGAMHAFRSSVTVENRLGFPLKFTQETITTGKKAVPSYKTKLFRGKVLGDLNIEGFRCYIVPGIATDWKDWKCIRKERQIMPKTKKSKTVKKDIIIPSGATKKIFSIDRDHTSSILETVRWWKKGIVDPDPVPSRLKKAWSREYPFETKVADLYGGGGQISLLVKAERAGSLDAFKTVALTALATAGAALLIPGIKWIAAGYAALTADIIVDQKSFLFMDSTVNGIDAKVRYEAVSSGSIYKNLKIIIEPK